MSSKAPIIRQISWLSLLPQMIILGLFSLLWYQFDSTNFFLYTAITYFLVAQLLRRTIAKAHRKGMAKFKSGQFEEAIACFEKSYRYFVDHNWVDQYRFLTLLSSGKMSYKEMALNNIAFCHGQLGNGKLAKEYYQKTLDEFPDNELAKAGLRLLNSMNDPAE